MEKKMNSKHEFEDWIYEKLYEAIMQAIAQSKEVEDVLKSLESRGLTQKMAAFNLILCLEELTKLTKDFPKKKHSSEDLNSFNISDNFDEARWLKQAKIIF